MAGRLYIVSTPIGHAEDLTFRAVRVLHDAHLIVAERASVTRHLLANLGLQTPVTEYDPGKRTIRMLIAKLLEGNDLALVADSGTPVLSDPGSRLIEEAWKAGVRGIPIPGPSALLAALAASGLGEDGFVFQGSLPRNAERRTRVVMRLKTEPLPSFFLLEGTQLQAFLRSLRALAPRRTIVVAADLTTPAERVVRGSLEDVIKLTATRRPGNDVTVVVGGVEGGRKSKPQLRRRGASG